MNFDDFNITSNGDGTYTLTPKNGTAQADALVAEYRAIKARGENLLAKRARINAELTELVARRDELKAILLGDGVDPEPVPDPTA